jgi:two-component system, NtrC family, response regulator AtoC
MTHQKQIFIVEDNEVFSLMLDYTLSQDAPYRFVRFSTGEECLANLHLNPDLVILDYGLPGMNGYDTLKEIEKRRPHTHVLMFTNNKDRRLEENVKQAGADDVVLKQDGGERRIAKKIKQILEYDEPAHAVPLYRRPLLAGLVVLLLITVLIVLGMNS